MKTNIRILTGLLILAMLLMAIPVSKSQEEPKYVLEICVAVVVVGVGAVVVCGLCKLAKKIPPTDPQPPAPPTNAPPTTNHLSFHLESQPACPVVQMEGTNGEIYDISSYGFLDPDGQPYTSMYALAINSSTNFRQWSQECCITGWMSYGWCVAICYQGGAPVSTNWSQSRSNVVNAAISPAASKFFMVTSP